MDWNSILNSGASAYGAYTNQAAARDNKDAANAAARAAALKSNSNLSQYLPWIIGGVLAIGALIVGASFLRK